MSPDGPNVRAGIDRKPARLRAAALMVALSLFVLPSCAENRNLAMLPPGAATGEAVSVFVATNRKDISEPEQSVRSPEVRRLRVDVRVPPKHAIGTLGLPRGTIDPDTDFLAQAAVEYPSASRFEQDIRTRLMAMPPERREITLYVHGYNNTFAKGVLRLAQLHHDLEQEGVLAHFSWPSAGSALGYGYDRDSVLYSRDALVSFLKSLSNTNTRILLVGHSMGAQLSMEALRQIEIASPGWGKRHLGGVILLSPDIDVDVFRSQVATISELPQPFVIFVSDQDHALALSSLILRDAGRLGEITDPADIADLDITLVDVSDFASGIGHFNIGTSPALIRMLQRLGDVESSFRGEGLNTATLPEGVVLTVQNVTAIILSPLSSIR